LEEGYGQKYQFSSFKLLNNSYLVNLQIIYLKGTIKSGNIVEIEGTNSKITSAKIIV
jgi:hypothetical protein